MFLNVPRNSFVSALSKVQSIVERKASMPVLEHVKIEVRGGVMSLTTTDMDITAKATFNFDSEFDVSFTTVVQPLYDVARKIFGCDEIKLELSNIQDGTLSICTDTSNFRLPCLPSDSFPNFDNMMPMSKFEISAESLAFIFNKTKHAMSVGEVRYYLNGVYVHVVDSTDDNNIVHNLVAVATDVHRLAKAEVKMSEGLSGGLHNVIIPRKSVMELCKILESCKSDDIVEVEVAEHKIKFATDGITLTSKIVDASFPNYAGALITDNMNSSVVNTKDLAKAVDLVTTISESKMKSVRMVIEREKISLSVDNQLSKYGKQIVEARSDVEKSFEILLNARYLLDALSTIECAQTELRFLCSATTNPVNIRGYDEGRAECVLMPMQFGE